MEEEGQRQPNRPPLPPHGSITSARFLDSYHDEMLMSFLHQRLFHAFPGKILEHPRWVYQNTGGIYARQLLLLLNANEYLCLWRTELPQSGFSGYLGNYVHEGDVLISGEIQSSDPESKLSAVRSYRFGQTSLLEPGRRRQYTLGARTAMLSFGMRSNMGTCLWTGLLAPFLFANQDWRSFKGSLEDARASMIG